MSILPTGCRAADPAAGRRPPTGSPADARRTARRSSAGAIRCGRRRRCDKTCEPKTEDPTGTTCPPCSSTTICSPGRHSRSGSSTTALHAPPPAATLRLTRQPWRATLIDSPMAPRSTPSHAAAGSSGCAWRGATTNLDSHPRCTMPGDHRSRTARRTPRTQSFALGPT
jgi:hypothetical protein